MTVVRATRVVLAAPLLVLAVASIDAACPIGGAPARRFVRDVLVRANEKMR